MKILHLIATLDPSSGGPAESVRVLMSFRELGYVGEAVTLDDPASTFLKDLDFPVHALGPASTRFAYSRQMFRWVQANYERFDGVIVNGLWNFCGVVAWLALGRRKPYMVFSHGMLDPYFKREFPLKHLKKWAYWLPVQYWILKRAFRVLFTTKEESLLAEESFWLHRWTGYVVPYGCSRPPKDKLGLFGSFFARVPELKGQRFLLYLGRIHRKKGCDLLINAFIHSAANDPTLHLVMAGPDEQGWCVELQSQAARAGLRERVHWPGMLKGDAKWGAFYACEAFILPSHQENFGIAVAEALACGRAVLLTDKVNIAAQIERDGAGLMQPDTQQGADALILGWMALPDGERSAMEAQALVTFHQRYDMQGTAEAIIQLFAIANEKRA